MIIDRIKNESKNLSTFTVAHIRLNIDDGDSFKHWSKQG
ncbi:hypothetical protein METHPM2_60014 [Pseudomonas sp. PM2]